MKQLLISFLSLVIVLTTPTFGQVDSVTDQYMGNGNLLVNPGLESGLKSWTNVAGVLSVESSVVIKGKRAGKVVLSSQALNLYQDVTSYQAQLADGVQGLASVRVKTSVSGVRVCPRQAGVITSTLCVNVLANGKWGIYKVPFSLGATSNGISINSNGTSVSGSVYVDDAFMGPQELSLETNACNDTSCETNFTASINGSDVVSGENLDWIVGDCTDANVGRQTCTFKTGLFTVTPNCVATAGPIGGSYQYANIYSLSSTSVTIEIRRTDSNIPINNQSIISCSKQGADFTAAKQLSNGNTYSSKNADTDWASCGLTGAAFTGFGSSVPTPELQCKRQGADLLIKGKFTAGTTPTAVEARMALPTWNGVQLVSAGSSVIPSIQLAGPAVLNFSSTTYFGFNVLIEPSVAYTTFSLQTSSANALGKQTGSSIANSGQVMSINARIPIEGWQGSNIIVGSFSGLESCTSTLDCTDTFSAKVSAAGVVSDENIDWIDGNCTLTGTANYKCNYKSGINTVPLNCSVFGNAFHVAFVTPVLATRTEYETYGSLHTQQAAPAQIICQKQGADYIGKTAKAVASDQNIRSIGAVGVDMQSVYFAGSALGTACSTSPCVIYRQVGSKITSVSRVAIGQYNLNGIDGTKYQCTGTAYSNAGTNRVAMLFDSSASSSTQATISSQGVDTSYNSIICIGIP